MSDELNIPGDREQKKLLDYLNGHMSEQERHDFEKKADDDAFLFEAMEGLEEVKNKKQLESLVQQLNNDLKKQINKKNARKEKRKIKEQPWVYFAIVLLLILIVAGYLVIKQFKA